MLTDEAFMRLALSCARQARARGDDPFGAVLVRSGVVLATSADCSVSDSDPTRHAELALISDYCRAQGVVSLEGCTLYASCEPCIMCAGAIHWARIARVVLSVPQSELQRITGGRPKPTCEELVNVGHRRVEVVGGVLLKEGLAILREGEWLPKAERHARRRHGRAK